MLVAISKNDSKNAVAVTNEPVATDMKKVMFHLFWKYINLKRQETAKKY